MKFVAARSENADISRRWLSDCVRNPSVNWGGLTEQRLETFSGKRLAGGFETDGGRLGLRCPKIKSVTWSVSVPP